MSTQELLKKSLLFRGSSSEEVDLALGMFHERQVQGNTVIFTERSPAEAIYVIKSGSVRISMKDGSGRDADLLHLGPGEFFGELALLQEHHRVVSAKTDGPTELVFMTRKDFQGLLDIDPRTGARILLGIAQLLAMRVAAYSARLKELL